MMTKRVAMCVSGGVDSTASAILLKSLGVPLVGVFMKNWDILDEHGNCSTDKDREFATQVCKQLHIPFHEVNFVRQYWNGVFSEMITDYQQGLTPNPDILCNRVVKFDALIDAVQRELGIDTIATGHYAQTCEASDGGVRLMKAADSFKDQTFFLSQVPQAALKKTLFPIGKMLKREVKKLVSDHGFSEIADKKESMGICFIGKKKFQHFIGEYISPSPGKFIHIETGEILGEHQGIHLYTLGQKAPLGCVGSPYFVQCKHPGTNDITVAPGTLHPSLFSRSFTTDSPYWIYSEPEELGERGEVRVEFRFQNKHPLSGAVLTRRPAGGLDVSLDENIRALTPGQYAVFYIGSECIGSARIIQPGPSLQDVGEPVQGYIYDRYYDGNSP